MFEHVLMQFLGFAVVGIACLLVGIDYGTHRERVRQNDRIGGLATDVRERIFTGRWPA